MMMMVCCFFGSEVQWGARRQLDTHLPLRSLVSCARIGGCCKLVETPAPNAVYGLPALPLELRYQDFWIEGRSQSVRFKPAPSQDTVHSDLCTHAPRHQRQCAHAACHIQTQRATQTTTMLWDHVHSAEPPRTFGRLRERLQ